MKPLKRNTEKIREVLKETLELFGEEGENWAKEHEAFDKKGSPIDPYDLKACKFCLSGAIKRKSYSKGVMPLHVMNSLMETLEKFYEGDTTNLFEYNDLLSTEFKDIKYLVNTTIKELSR